MTSEAARVTITILLAPLVACGDSTAAPSETAADAGIGAGGDAGMTITPSDAAATDAGGARDTDASFAPDAAIPLGDPITVAPEDMEQWVWIEMPEMTCGDGNAGGFAVNLTDRSRDLLFFLQGGGICYNAITCAVGGAPRTVGPDPLATALDPAIRDGRGAFDRDDADNPFRDMSYVVLPHCTGDFHLGAKTTRYPTGEWHHRGYTNVTRAIERVVPTFLDAGRIVLAGFSAGGVGITGNYHQIALAFEAVGQPPPYLIADAGPLMRPPFLEESTQAALRESWGLAETVDPLCPSCVSEGFHEAYRMNGLLHPGLRSSMLCSYADGTVVLLYSVMNGIFTADRMRMGLGDLADWTETFEASAEPSVHRVFYYEGDRHGAMSVDALSATPGLGDFLRAQLSSEGFHSVRP